MTHQKKLMMLGGIRYLLPAIEAAHKLGYYVITCDYLPDNIAHKYSDEFVNASVIDKELILQIAREKKIDGIISYGVDPAVVTAAYVQQQMGLPSMGPYESVCILQDKDLFRSFLAKNGFNVPRMRVFSSFEEAVSEKEWYQFPVIVKPTDGSGSKGVTRVDSFDQLAPAVEHALDFSRCKKIIVEEYIEKEGCSSDTDCFSVDGEMRIVTFSAQRFDAQAANPYTPSAYSWPSTFTAEQEKYLAAELQRAITLLGMRTALYNIETRIGTNHKPYIMEITPRAGGNRLAEMVRYATGADMVTAAVKAAMGEDVSGLKQQPYNGHWAEVILHASKDGKFSRLVIDGSVNATIVEEDLWVKPGDEVEAFNGASNAIGTLVLKFNNEEDLNKAMENQAQWLKVIVE